MSSESTEQCATILATFRILPSDVRVQVLSTILTKSGESFSIMDIHETVKMQNPTISRSAVQSTLQLFQARHIIQALSAQEDRGLEHRRRGRPELKYVSKL